MLIGEVDPAEGGGSLRVLTVRTSVTAAALRAA
jgi:hypothetical protein